MRDGDEGVRPAGPVTHMNPEAMAPYGLALLAYFEGRSAAEVVIRRDDGVEERLPMSPSFRAPADFTPIEAAALERCRGHVLDVGAGSGLHSLALQSRGLTVTAIDIDPQAVAIMAQRGVRVADQADVFEYRGGRFDTLVLLGHGIGFVEDLEGLDRFLAHAHGLLRSDGQMLLHSLDVSRSRDAKHLAYHDANRRAGRYIGEIRMQLEFQGRRGPFFGWLHVDPRTLADHADRTGWSCETVLAQESGEYLARLVPRRAG
jgi:SAM-dependent methyltransferase